MKTQLSARIKTLLKFATLALVLGTLAFLVTCSDGIVMYDSNSGSGTQSQPSSPSQPGNPNPPDTSVPWSPLTPATKIWTVTVYTNDGTGAPQTYQVKNGATFDLTALPQYEAHKFLGFKDDFGNDFVLNSTPVTRNVAIIAQWLSLWKVTIDQNGGTGLTQTEYIIEDGQTLNASDIKGTSTLAYMVANTSVYRAIKPTIDGPKNVGDFTLGVTPVKSDLILAIKWSLSPTPVGPNGQAIDYSSKGITPLNAPTKFAEAINNGDLVGVIGSLIEGGGTIDLDNPIRGSYTPVMVLAEIGNLELVKYLVAMGASTIKNSYVGATAAIIAASYGNLVVSQYLLDHPQ